MSKRLTKTIWYGSDVDSNGNPILPSTHGGLDGLNYGELYLHLSNGKATLWTLSSDGKIVEITGGGSVVDMSSYLLKSIWDKVWEIRTDSQGTEYIFCKLPVVTQYGITMYSGDGVDVPSLASGLPFDGRTIWYNPDTQQIEVIGGTGGGSGEGVSNFWDLSGIPSWITISKPKYTYSEIEGTPDLTKYALASQIPSLSGYATESWVAKQNYATKATTLSGYGITDAYTKTNVDDLLKSYVTLGGTQTITGEKNFTGGLKVNGSPIYYDTEKKYWKLEGDLLVTGGVTMYGSDSSFVPSTIMDAIAVDGTTISKSGGVLKVIGGTGGGVADSVAWANITGKPTWIGSSKPTYSYSEITGAISTTELQNYLTSNSYLNVTSGDNRYLKLSGGTIKGHIDVYNDGDYSGVIGFNRNSRTGGLYNTSYNGHQIHNYKGDLLFFVQKTNNTTLIPITIIGNSGNVGIGTTNPAYKLDVNGTLNATTIYQNGQTLANTYLPLSGGTLTSDSTILTLKRNNIAGGAWIDFYNNSGKLGAIGIGGSGSPVPNDVYYHDAVLVKDLKIWHEGNDGSGSGLDADLLDGLESNMFGQYIYGGTFDLNEIRNGFRAGKLYGATNAAPGSSNRCFLEYGTMGYATQFNSDSTNNLYYRCCENGIWKNWRTVAFTDSNVASATKLQTARTIWGQSFDGTGNVEGTMTGLGYILGFNAIRNSSDVNQTHGIWVGNVLSSSLVNTDLAYHATKHIFLGGNIGIGTVNPQGKLQINHSTFSDGLTLNRMASGGGSSVRFLSEGTLLGSLGVNGSKTFEFAVNDTLKFTVDSNGNGLFYGGVTMYSDQRKKTILNHVELSLKQIAEAPLIEHYYNSDDKKTTHVGSIAQYWASMNDWFCKLDSEGYYTMEIQNAALASAISIARELDRYETKTDKAIKKLKKRISELEEEVERLKSA